MGVAFENYFPSTRKNSPLEIINLIIKERQKQSPQGIL